MICRECREDTATLAGASCRDCASRWLRPPARSPSEPGGERYEDGTGQTCDLGDPLPAEFSSGPVAGDILLASDWGGRQEQEAVEVADGLPNLKVGVEWIDEVPT